MATGASQRLHEGVAAVETMTRFAVAVLALASGVYISRCAQHPRWIGNGGLLCGYHLFSVGFGRNLRVLVLHGPLLSARDHAYG